MRLKDKYTIAVCCRPVPGDAISGYYSYHNIIKVHKAACSSLGKADPDRLMALDWADILVAEDSGPDGDFRLLDEIDFLILGHHRSMGVDYSLKVAAVLRLDKQTVFDRHARLRDLGLLCRVEPRMIRYRKNIAPGKWIKHRNHTYYDLTDKGRGYLVYHNGLKPGR